MAAAKPTAMIALAIVLALLALIVATEPDSDCDDVEQ
jgi:hypothetical protein